jgi:hypothetical protein
MVGRKRHFLVLLLALGVAISCTARSRSREPCASSFGGIVVLDFMSPFQQDRLRKIGIRWSDSAYFSLNVDRQVGDSIFGRYDDAFVHLGLSPRDLWDVPRFRGRLTTDSLTATLDFLLIDAETYLDAEVRGDSIIGTWQRTPPGLARGHLRMIRTTQ